MFVIISNLIGFIIYPLHLLIVLFLIYFILKRFKFFKLFSKFILGLSILLIFIGSSTFISDYMLWKLENVIPMTTTSDANGIILLGGSFKHLKEPLKIKQSSFNETADRVIEALYILNQNPDLKIINFADAGLGKQNDINEAKLARDFFEKLGINSNRIITNPIAQNTFQESIAISKFIFNLKGNWILITSASHMPRSVNLFQSRNLNKAIIFPYPTDFTVDKPNVNFNFHFSNFNKQRKILHEVFGLFGYWITGRTNNLWPDLDDIPINHP